MKPPRSRPGFFSWLRIRFTIFLFFNHYRTDWMVWLHWSQIKAALITAPKIDRTYINILNLRHRTSQGKKLGIPHQISDLAQMWGI